ncbi:MAG: TIGR02757 family protein [Candidatus Pseudobacter hemicellulosilyticus]|uniref:TIGR02757 family protein n=1 Tax=Candidatus Pseudobacter hemicellulosilyticus TaxID=3121375 RepID=A0AAJ6BIX0_9BACT|nr:MAG: TIGR02757 family protein [Pseudobacter sp.]
MPATTRRLAEFLNRKAAEYNRPSFIKDDPISIPHLFTRKQDIEIAGLFAAIFAWGNRTTIIRKTTELMQLMDNAPHQFVMDSAPRKLKALEVFKHRTFNTTDLYYFIEFLQHHYTQHESLEAAFTKGMQPGDTDVENALTGFYEHFFSLEAVPARTRKHIATPARKSSCKRLNMYLRWMVRKDNNGVDLGIWNTISMAQLVCPIDLHVARVAKRFGLLQRPQADWLAAQELTGYLRKLDPDDPARYDFALFGLGVVEKF